jgi:glycosyltransferase involved in cell wall biosynthesis
MNLESPENSIMDNSFPRVSVIMPVYNSEKYLCEAVESILAQTLRDLEIIAIDDGSTDSSLSILKRYHQQDKRTVILTHSKNQGIVSALNRGLKMGRGKYIARMDADDISLPERLEKQVEFLESHPQVGILGTDALFMDTQGREIARMVKARDDLSIRWMSLFSTPFFHPTVMIRRSVLIEYNLNYLPGVQSAEDYDLWLRLLEHTQGANLDWPYLRYRISTESISSQRKHEQMEKHNQISLAYIQRLFPEIRFSPAEHAMLAEALTGRFNPSNYCQRPALSIRYLELWRAFVGQHHGNPALKYIRHEAVNLAAKIGLYPPFQPGWLETMSCLFAADPLWIFYFIIKFSNMVHLKVLGIRLSRLRRVKS